MEENRQKSVRPQNKNLKPGGPGRPKGKKNFATVYREALEYLAKLNSTTPEALENEMYANAIKKARAGDYAFYRDTVDRLHGKPFQPIGGQDGSPLIIQFDGAFTRKTKSNSGE